MKANFFRSADHFLQQRQRYRILPFRFMRWADGRVFLSTDVGEWLFLSTPDFEQFTAGTLSKHSESYSALKSKHILADSDSTVPLQLLATKLRTKYAFLDGFTSLHMFVVTLRCDHSCPYCQVSRVTQDKTRYDMSMATAERAVEWVFRSPAPAIKIEFQGGESLLNFDLVRFVVETAELRNRTENRNLQFVIATNLAHLTDEMLQVCLDHGIILSTSLDGPATLHNANRPRPGNDSHERVEANVKRARAVLGHDRVAALMTTTERSLQSPEDIVDEYVRLEFPYIFLRPISPYGFAIKSKQAFKYQTDAFLVFYKRALARVVDWNRRGVPIVEAYSQLLLRKLLTPFPTGYVDLQSPAGLGISAIVYNYDGDVYASDEGRMLAEMNDRSFRLGNLHTDAYDDVLGGEYLSELISKTCTVALPGCTDCAFVPFCGSDPVYNWATQGDIVGYRPSSGFCRKHMNLFQSLIDGLESGDDFMRSLFTKWAVS